MINHWDILGEYHWLINRKINETNEGFLGQVQYHVNKNMKLGVGYNFTSFSDDLRLIGSVNFAESTQASTMFLGSS